jgi:hypothetical protein
MIYADPSFLCSLYGWDDNTQRAQSIYVKDGRRPLYFTPWQRFEFRNAMRLATHKLRRAGKSVPFEVGNIFRRVTEDLSAGRLRHADPEWRDIFHTAEDLSAAHTETIGAASVDIWHIAAAAALDADTFWTFDDDQWAVAKASKRFRSVPSLFGA